MTTPPLTAQARYPYHENPLLVDALEFAHQRALVGLVHTAPYWRDCEFFPCNAYDRIEAADAARLVRDACVTCGHDEDGHDFTPPRDCHATPTCDCETGYLALSPATEEVERG